MAAGAAVSAVLELERAVLDALRGDAGVRAVLGNPARVFDTDMERPAFPFLEIARHAMEDISGADAAMGRHELDLAVMTSAGGREEAKEAAAAVKAVIDGAGLSIEGYRCVTCTVSFIDVVRASVHHWRALIRVRAVVEAGPD